MVIVKFSVSLLIADLLNVERSLLKVFIMIMVLPIYSWITFLPGCFNYFVSFYSARNILNVFILEYQQNNSLISFSYFFSIPASDFFLLILSFPISLFWYLLWKLKSKFTVIPSLDYWKRLLVLLLLLPYYNYSSLSSLNDHFSPENSSMDSLMLILLTIIYII